MQADPIGLAGGANLYGYANANPVMYVDRDGRFFDLGIDLGFIGYDLYRLYTEGPCNVGENLLALGADVVGAVIPFATGLGTAVRYGDDVVDAAESAYKALPTQRAATREAKRQAGIPTSQQPVSQHNGAARGTKVGRQQTFETPKPRGGIEQKSVQVSRDIRGKHAGKPQIEAGTIKSGRQIDAGGRPRIDNPGKVRVDFKPRR